MRIGLITKLDFIGKQDLKVTLQQVIMNNEYNSGKINPTKYGKRFEYNSQVGSLSALVSGEPKDRPIYKHNRKEWEKLRDELKKLQENSLVLDWDAAVWTYAQNLCIKKKLDFFKALDTASKRIGSLRRKVTEKYPLAQPELEEVRENEYYSRLYKLFSKLNK